MQEQKKERLFYKPKGIRIGDLPKEKKLEAIRFMYTLPGIERTSTSLTYIANTYVMTMITHMSGEQKEEWIKLYDKYNYRPFYDYEGVLGGVAVDPLSTTNVTLQKIFKFRPRNKNEHLKKYVKRIAKEFNKTERGVLKRYEELKSKGLCK